MPLDPLGRKPGVFLKLKPEQRKLAMKKVFEYIARFNTLETACWAAEVPPDELQAVMDRDEHVKNGVLAHLARAEAQLVEIMLTGGNEGKAAEQALKLTRSGWRPSGSKDVLQQFEEAFAELKGSLSDDQYNTVVKTFLKYA